MTSLKLFSPTHRKLIDSLFDRVRTYYSDRLVSLAVYGSYARRENRFDSDLDLLIVLERILEKRRLKRVESFVKEVEMPLDSLSSACFHEGLFVDISPLILSREQASSFLPIYLDMAEYCLILSDKGSFLQNRLDHVKQQMIRWGSRKKEIGGHWYWEIRPGTRWNEVIDYDK